MSLDPAVEARLESGHIDTIDLVRIDLPGKTVGYHMGGRPFTWNGLLYLPNRFLRMGNALGVMGNDVTAREIIFSNVPVEDPNDAIATVEQYAYINAPVIISNLMGDAESDTPLGILATYLYEIDDLSYEEGAADELGRRTLTIKIQLEPPGRSVRDRTLVKQSHEEQQFDNSATDTFLETASTTHTVQKEWGQTGGSSAGNSGATLV